jgi:histidine ammonia-lyase
MARAFPLDGSNLDLATVRHLLAGEAPRLVLRPAVRRRVAESARFVERLVAGDTAVYGITTGFGRLAKVRIAATDLARLQERLVVSHAAGVGDPLPEADTRLAIVVRAATLAGGHSGVRVPTLEALLGLWNERVTPLGYRRPASGGIG